MATPCSRSSAPAGSGTLRQHVEHLFELPLRVAVLAEIQPAQQLAEHIRVAARLAHRLDDRLARGAG